jgi:hypothetical protein
LRWRSRRSKAVINGRKAIGIELKPSYYRQAVKNCKAAAQHTEQEAMPLFCAGPDVETEGDSE